MREDDGNGGCEEVGVGVRRWMWVGEGGVGVRRWMWVWGGDVGGGGRCGCEEVGVGGELGVDVEVDVGGREVDMISKGVI